MLKLTDTAIHRLHWIAERNNSKYCRLSVKGGGCAGYEYEWSFADDYTRDDHIIDDMLLVHKMFELYLTGTEIDYNKDDFGATFKFSNASAKSSCGCGTSFSI